MSDWQIYQGANSPHDGIDRLPPPPPWRDFHARSEARGSNFRAGPREVEVVNAALYLRRPLLVTGPPGSGKSSLAYAVAWELKLGPVLRWSINSRSTLADGLYRYDALARLRDANLGRQEDGRPSAEPAGQDIGRYLRLGPLGTALLPRDRPRVLLVDEIDKSDIDLPNDLLHVFEEGEFEVPELQRIADREPEVAVLPDYGAGNEDRVVVTRGRVRCQCFPFVVLTSNGERELPPAFLRRCLRLDIPDPDADKLRHILRAHLAELDPAQVEGLLDDFVKRRDMGQRMATDQLLNAVFLVTRGRVPEGGEREEVLKIVLRELGRG